MKSANKKSIGVKNVSNHILLKRSGGTDGHYLFYSPKQGLCCRAVKENVLGTREVLIEHIRPDFDAVIDAENNIHIVCQDRKKNILYFFYHGEKWEKRIILQAKEGTEAYAGQFRLFYRSGYLRMTYVMEHKGEKLLCAHELHTENSVPQVLDVLDSERDGYAVTLNQSSDTVLCYYSKERQALGTQTYLWSQKKWGTFERIEGKIAPPIDLQIYADPQDTLHLCYKSNGTLYYRRKEFRFEQSLWSAEQILARRQNNFSAAPAFFCTADRLWLCRTSGMALTAVTSPLQGGDWSREQEVTGSRGSKGILFLLHSAASSEAMAVPRYGFIRNNQIKLLGETDYFVAEKKQSVRVDGVDIPIREIAASGSEVERFAAQNSYAGESSYMPGGREEIEKEKRRIKELLSGQTSPDVGAIEESNKNTAAQDDFDDFSAEYFYELLRKEEEQAASVSPMPKETQIHSVAEPQSVTQTGMVSSHHAGAETAEMAQALSLLADALNDLTVSLRRLEFSKGKQKSRHRKLAKLHNKIK